MVAWLYFAQVFAVYDKLHCDFIFMLSIQRSCMCMICMDRHDRGYYDGRDRGRSGSRSPDRAPSARGRSPARSFHQAMMERGRSSPPRRERSRSPFGNGGREGYANGPRSSFYGEEEEEGMIHPE